MQYKQKVHRNNHVIFFSSLADTGAGSMWPEKDIFTPHTCKGCVFLFCLGIRQGREGCKTSFGSASLCHSEHLGGIASEHADLQVEKRTVQASSFTRARQVWKNAINQWLERLL